METITVTTRNSSSGSTRTDSRQFKFEPTYTGNTGNDLGISTVGYRSAKHNPAEWHEANYNKYYQSFVDRDGALQTKHSANDIVRESIAAEQRIQAENTKKLAERLKDINFWKFELQREIGDVIAETDLLISQKKRLENSLRSTEIPLHIATDNLNVRARRQGIDLVQGDVELNLLKEVEIINNAQDLLRRTIKEAELQVKRNRDRKQILEMDWSDKKEADGIDSFCANLRNEHTCKQFYPGAARFQEVQSTPESWAQFTHDNIVGTEHERLASVQLRGLIDNVLIDISRDIKEQADAVDMALRRRVDEIQDAKAKLQDNLKRVCSSIVAAQSAIEAIKNAIKAKEDQMKVAQTRLHQREFRPNVELCRDPAQYGLIEEVGLLSQSVDALLQKLVEAENDLRGLQDERMVLEKDISCKENSLFIDREKCIPHRTRYPTISQLQGYN